MHVTNEGVGLWLETQLAYAAYFDDDRDPKYRNPKATFMNGRWENKVREVFRDCAKLARVEHDLAAGLLIAFAHEDESRRLPSGVPSESEIRRYVERQWMDRPEVQGWRLVDLSNGGIRKLIEEAPRIRFTKRIWMIERPSNPRIGPN